MAVIHNIKSFIQDTRADAIVEATILFPIVIMIFTAMALLAVYLPERAVLAQATQYAANAISIEQSDTWLDYSEERGYKWVSDKSQLKNVYIQMFSALGAKTDSDSAETIVRELDGNSILAINGSLEVRVEVENYIIYKEVTVTSPQDILEYYGVTPADGAEKTGGEKTAEERILACMGAVPVHLDRVAAELKISRTEAMKGILKLKKEDRIRETARGYFVLS